MREALLNVLRDIARLLYEALLDALDGWFRSRLAELTAR
jgi:hypothetical protein